MKVVKMQNVGLELFAFLYKLTCTEIREATVKPRYLPYDAVESIFTVAAKVLVIFRRIGKMLIVRIMNICGEGFYLSAFTPYQLGDVKHYASGTSV